MHANTCIAGAGSPRDEADAGAAGELAVGICHISGAAFLAAYDQPDFAAHVVKRIKHRKEAFSGHREDRVRAMNPELIDHKLAASAHTGWVPLHHNLLAFS